MFVRLAATLHTKGLYEEILPIIISSIFRAFKRKEMKALHPLAENDIITRGGNYENPSSDAKGEDE